MALAGPGARLRAKRESMGLSAEQMADKLRLDVRYIVALEQDNHADIAAPVFVRGYLRSYAALLQLPADAIVECYAADDAGTAALFDGPAQPKPKQRISAPELRWLIGIGGAALVVIVAVAIIFGERLPSLFGVEQTTPPASTTASSTAAGAEALPPEASDAAAAAVENAGQTLPGSPPAPGATHKVALRFSADSWVVISDGSGKELLYELMRSGSTRVLEGVQPPLQVVLGNASAVTVEYNDVLFDHSRFSTNGVARFTLGVNARR